MGEETREWAYPAGFTDYAFFYPNYVLVWVIIGFICFTITMISYLPQPIKLVQKRTSYGLAVFSVLAQSCCLWGPSFNVLCLKYRDFAGLMRYNNQFTFARFMTFILVFGQFCLYLPVVFQMWIFFDRKPRLKRDEDAIKKDQTMILLLPIVAISSFVFCLVLWVSVGLVYGLDSHAIILIGKVAGYFAFVLEIIQFIPQTVTTIKLRDHGSLSLLMLKVQAPANLANAFYMWLGAKEDFTTFAASLADGVWEFIILGLCIYFKSHPIHREQTSESMSEIHSSLL